MGVLWKLIVTQCRCIKKCNLKLYYAMRKAFINLPQKRHRVLWAQSHLSWTERQVKRVHISACFCEKRMCAKDEKDHPDCYQGNVQKPPL